MSLLTHSFNIWGRLDRDKFCDIKLLTQCGSSILAHKLILSAVSKKLSVVFEKSPNLTEFKIRNVKIESLTLLVDFIYEGKVQIDDQVGLSDFADAFTVLNMYMGPKVSSVIKNLNSLNGESEKDSQETVYKCDVCGKGYESQTQLSRHKRTKHMERKRQQKYKCVNCSKEYSVGTYFSLMLYAYFLMQTQRDVEYCACKTDKRKRSKNSEKKTVGMKEITSDSKIIVFTGPVEPELVCLSIM